jgi:hypothetical protein
MKKSVFLIFLFLGVGRVLWPQAEPDLLPLNLLAFPFGSQDYLQKITTNPEYLKVWSEKRIMAWAQEQGFFITEDSPEGGYQYKRGLIVKSPGLDFVLSAPVTARAESQAYGWKLVLDLGALYSPSFENRLTSNFNNYENILRYDIYIDDIYYKTIEMGYGISSPTPVIIEIPYIRDISGNVYVSIKLKNHPANFAVIYDAFLTL